jgi:hypothetical protein
MQAVAAVVVVVQQPAVSAALAVAVTAAALPLMAQMGWVVAAVALKVE